MRAWEMKFVFVVCLFGLLISCRPERSESPISSAGVELGRVDWRLDEVSGLVASKTNPGFLWALNDSGNTAEIFLIDLQAKVRLVCKLDNIQNRDWEDITLASGPDKKNYIYIADVGDNFLNYDNKLVYRFEEPLLTADTELLITQFDTYNFRMPDGRHDAETILVDPVTNDLFIISKERRGAGIYQAPQVLVKDTMTLKKMMTLPFRQIVAASITSDGRKLLLKSYQHIYYWEKTDDENILQLLIKTPDELPYTREPQGEAIAWSRDGSEFYTLSESTWREHASLLVYKQKIVTNQE